MTSLDGARLQLEASADLYEQIRQAVGSRWVEEILLDASVPRDIVWLAVRASRQVGRPIRIIGTPAWQLPSIVVGERWSHEVKGRQDTWILRRSRPTVQRLLKRVFDLLVSGLLIILLGPVLLGIALAIRLSSPGPIIYRWRVLGRNGRPFVGYKFRTMIQDADAKKTQLLARNEMIGPVFKLAADPRVTRVGRWLRRYSLDELPQLWNVLKGDMSLVGPRPVFRDEYRHFELWQMRKLSIIPGVTCLWQVSGRNAIRDLGEWARLDLRYIDNWSLALDAQILVRTIGAVLKGTGV